jgi:hypothetical protein
MIIKINKKNFYGKVKNIHVCTYMLFFLILKAKDLYNAF